MPKRRGTTGLRCAAKRPHSPRAIRIMKRKFIKYKTPIVITASLIVLQAIWGFDPKFCLINVIWLFVQDYE